jgi:hypothetical protein
MYINIYMYILIYVDGKDPVVLEDKEYSEYVYKYMQYMCIYLFIYLFIYIYIYIYIYI